MTKKLTTLFLMAMLLCGVSYGETTATNHFGADVTKQSTMFNVHSYKQGPKYDLSTISSLPAPGIVNALSEIKLTFVGISKVEVNSTSENYQPKLEKTDGTLIISNDVTADGNTLIVKFSPEVTEEATYNFIIPRQCLLIDGGSLASDVTLTYTIGSTSDDNGIITMAPDGEKVNCQSDFLSYFVLDGGLSGMPIAGKPLHYVIGEDGNLYLYNIMTIQPYGGVQTSSYIVGTPSGDNIWKFSFPQPIYETSENGEREIWYVNYLYTYVDPRTGASTYKIYEENNSVEFKINENGDAVWLNGNEDSNTDDGFAIGATLPDGTWTGFANVVRSTYQKFTEVAIDINPQEYEIWKLTTGPNGNRVSRKVPVYFDGDDVYVKGFSKNYLPEAWAHGVIDGKTITFDTFIGECDIIGQYLFLYGYSDSNGRVPLEFKYYPEEKGMTCKNEYIINPNQTFYYVVESYEYPSLEFYSSGVDNIYTDDVVSTEWYSIDGIRVENPSCGIFIRRSILSSGKVEYTKTVFK